MGLVELTFLKKNCIELSTLSSSSDFFLEKISEPLWCVGDDFGLQKKYDLGHISYLPFQLASSVNII